MAILFRRFASAAPFVGLVLACACTKGATGTTTTAGTGAENADAVVAKWNGKTLTLKQVDEKAGDKLFELEKNKYTLRSQVIDTTIFEELIKAEATKAGMTEEAWMKAQVDPKIKQPSDEDVQKVFAENQSKMPPGATIEMMRPRIVDFLTQDQKGEVVRGIFDDLKKKAGVEVSLVEPRKPKIVVEAKGPARGPEGAKVTIVEFSDFQCPFCSRAHDTVEEVMQAYAGKVRLVFRHFPLEFHPNAPKAAEAAACAAEQGKFWEYHDVLFKNQQTLAVENLKEHATSVGLDGAKFTECLDSGRMAALVKIDTEAGKKAGVNGTPAFFINGNMISGAQPMEEFKKIIDEELKAAN